MGSWSKAEISVISLKANIERF